MIRRDFSLQHQHQSSKRSCSHLHIFIYFFLIFSLVNLLYMRSTSLMLSELENIVLHDHPSASTLILETRQNTSSEHVEISFNSDSLVSNQKNLQIANSSAKEPGRNAETLKISDITTVKGDPMKEAFGLIGSETTTRSKNIADNNRDAPLHKADDNRDASLHVAHDNSDASLQTLPTAQQSLMSDALSTTKWSKIKWQYSTGSKDFILEQIAPEQALAFATAYTASVKSKYPPPPPPPEQPTDFKRIKRIWIWGGSSHRHRLARSRDRRARLASARARAGGCAPSARPGGARPRRRRAVQLHDRHHGPPPQELRAGLPGHGDDPTAGRPPDPHRAAQVRHRRPALEARSVARCSAARAPAARPAWSSWLRSRASLGQRLGKIQSICDTHTHTHTHTHTTHTHTHARTHTHTHTHARTHK